MKKKKKKKISSKNGKHWIVKCMETCKICERARELQIQEVVDLLTRFNLQRWHNNSTPSLLLDGDIDQCSNECGELN